MVATARGAADWTWHEEAGGAWYVTLRGAPPPPYLRQKHVEAIVDLDADGRVCGIEVIDVNMPAPAKALTGED